MAMRGLTRLGPGMVLALTLWVAAEPALAQSQRRAQPNYANQNQQDQSYLDPGPAPAQTRVPNYVAIGQSDYSQPFHDSMADPGGTDFDVSPY